MTTTNPSEELQPSDSTLDGRSSIPRKDGEDAIEPEHPIASAINAVIHRIQDLEDISLTYIPMGEERKKELVEEALKDFREGINLLETDDHGAKIIGITKAINFIRR